MTDRELHELAAKAAGWKGWQSKSGYWYVTDPSGKEYVCCDSRANYDSHTGARLPEATFYDAVREAGFYPYADDALLYQIASTCKLVLDFHNNVVRAYVKGSLVDFIIDINNDEAACIVRAAAEIGKSI